MKIRGVLNLLSFMARFISVLARSISFLPRFISFFSFSRKNTLVLFPKSTYEVKPPYVLVVFLALAFFIVAVFFRSSLKPSDDSKHFHTRSISFLPLLEEYPLSYKVDEELLEETYSFTDIIDETYSLANVIEGNDQEFAPRVVHLELIKGATGSHADYKDLVPLSVNVEVIEGSIRSNDEVEEFHGYDGYDEDNDDDDDDECDEDDVDSNYENDGNDHDDLKSRIEEFIAKNIRKWKEEMVHDKLLYLEY